jgi:hypothetical protein
MTIDLNNARNAFIFRHRNARCCGYADLVGSSEGANNQSYLDNGIARDVIVVPFDRAGHVRAFQRIGSALDWRSAVALASEMGYRIAPEGQGFDCGHIANPDGPDAYGVPVLVPSEVCA